MSTTTNNRTGNTKFKRARHALIWAAEKEGRSCALCGGPIDYEAWKEHRRTDRSPELDHIIPVSRGGAEVVENYQVVHGICNRAKGAARTSRATRIALSALNRTAAVVAAETGMSLDHNVIPHLCAASPNSTRFSTIDFRW